MPTIEHTDKPQPLPRTPESLPHGLVTPPPEVRDAIERERAKHPAEAFARAEEGLLNQWTLDHYFDEMGHEVIYRPTPQGPEVLAVGDQERLELRQRLGQEEYNKLKSYLPY